MCVIILSTKQKGELEKSLKIAKRLSRFHQELLKVLK